MTQTQCMTADDLLGLSDVQYVMIPGFKEGQMLRIRSLTALDFVEWTEARDASPAARRDAGLSLIVKSAVDADGNLLFDASHVEKLRKVRHRVTESIIREIALLNGIHVSPMARRDEEPKNA